MGQTTPSPDAQALPVPPPPAEDTNARIERLEKTIAEMKKKEDSEKHGIGTTSKTALAAIFGFAGFKVVGFLGAKVGLLIDMVRGYFSKGGMEGFLEPFKVFYTFGQNAERPLDKIKYSLAVGGIGAVAGIIGGIWLAFARGDRLARPEDLMHHPITSLKKLFGPDSKKQAEKEATKEAPAKETDKTTVASAEHQGTVSAADAQRAL